MAGGPIAVSLEQVTFRYPGAAGPALQDLSLAVPAGALVAVTGAVGSGKSALARTLLGLYPLASGRVLLDGRPLDDLPAAERAARLGYLPQDAYVFSGSVRDNVLLASQASDSAGLTVEQFAERAVEQAMVWTALEQDLRGFPDGLDTQIGELGVRISGGQRQRIALARALVASAPAAPGLLVLDDPFSAVDVETESRILAGLRQAVGPLAPPERRATIILCSHRLAAFSRADLVVVLDRGRVIERGTHDNLVRAGGLYARIYLAQRRAGSLAPSREALE